MMSSSGEHVAPMVISSMMPGLREISILTVGGNVGYIIFLESVGGTDRVIELVYMP